MASLKQKKQDFRIARHGGLKHTEQFLKLRDINDFDPSLDVVFVSIDLKYQDKKNANLLPHLLKNSALQLSILDS